MNNSIKIEEKEIDELRNILFDIQNISILIDAIEPSLKEINPLKLLNAISSENKKVDLKIEKCLEILDTQF